MYYYPSVCANMSASACLNMNIESRYDQYPSQDAQVHKYFVNDNVSVGNQQLNHLTGQQLAQLRNHQMMNLSYGKRGRDNEDEDDNEFRKSISDSDINSYNNQNGFSSGDDDINMSEEDNGFQNSEEPQHCNKRHFRHYKAKPQSETARKGDQYPVFEHPEGGVIQFTPHGNIRTYFDERKGVEVSVLENETTFETFVNNSAVASHN